MNRGWKTWREEADLDSRRRLLLGHGAVAQYGNREHRLAFKVVADRDADAMRNDTLAAIERNIASLTDKVIAATAVLARELCLA